MVDKSIVRPVLEAVESLRSYKRDLEFYYRTVDRFSALWNGKPKEGRRIEEETAIWLAHDLLKEYLRFEGNTKRVALWLLTINRCCSNYGADLSGTEAEMRAVMENADLDFDRTLVEPILTKARTFEARHEKAVDTELGGQDTLGSFLQWIGIYCTYVYPRLKESGIHDNSMISAITFLISEFINLQENVSRMAALLLGIKEACSYAAGTPAEAGTGTGEPGGSAEVRPGTEQGIVEEILEKLREESASGGKPGGPKEGPRAADWAAEAVRQIADAAGGERRKAMEDFARAAEERVRTDRRGAGETLQRILAAEKPGFQERVRSTAQRMRQDPQAARSVFLAKLETSTGAGAVLLARLYVLSSLEARLAAAPPA